MTMQRAGLALGLPLLALALGVAVAIASSPSSLNPDRRGATSGFVAPSPSPIPSPSPDVIKPGLLGSAPRLLTNGSNTLVAIGAGIVIASGDGGHTWITLRPPSNGAAPLAVDPSNPRHAVAGGSTIQVTGDGGINWSAALSAAPGKGPYEPLAISALEPNVWFFAHQGKLLVTRDGSASWADVAALPPLSNPMLVSGQALGQFFLATGNRVFALSSYGQKVTELAPIGAGSVEDLAVIGGNQVSLVAGVAGHGAYVLKGGAWALASGLTGPVAGGASGAVVVGNGGARVGSPGLVSYSGDGGQTWAPGTGLPADETVDAIAGQPSSSAFFAYCSGGDLYVSTDGGHTWVLLSHALRGVGA